MSPPLRAKETQDRLWRGLAFNDLQAISTDHCPFCMKEQKVLGEGDFSKIPNGAPGVETRMSLVYDGGVRTGRISLNRFVEHALTSDEIVALSKKHTLFEWSAQETFDPLPAAKAKGCYFWTPDGKKYLDFNSQLMCVNIGHADDRVVRAIQQQAEVLPYANPFLATEPRAKLGAKLAEITPGDIDVFFFTNGGAEANENAFKIARAFTGRQKILARYRSYHGATAAAINATGDPRRWSQPPMAGIVHVLDPYHGIERGWESVDQSLSYLDEVIQLEGPQTIAAFILEPVTGTNGILVPPDGYMQGVRGLCDKHGILMICDEVMSGFGRTGEWFAVNH